MSNGSVVFQVYLIINNTTIGRKVQCLPDGTTLRITLEAVEKPPNWSLFEANRLNSPKLGVKFFDRLINYMQATRALAKQFSLYLRPRNYPDVRSMVTF